MKNKIFIDFLVLTGTALLVQCDSILPDMETEDFYTNFVNLSVIVEEFKISDIKNMEFVLNGILTQTWDDPRASADIRKGKTGPSLHIWKPAIINTNGHNKISNKDDSIFMRVFGEEGNVLLSHKFQIEDSCSIDFHKFPFDLQFCQVKFGSYRFASEEVTLVWDPTAVDLRSKIKTNEFHLLNISTHTEIDVRRSGNYSTAVIQFNLQRNSLHYVLCTGVPCIIMVLLTYISLWFNPNKRAIRLNILFLSFIVNLFFFYSSTGLIQPVPYLKALDVFVGICLSFSIIPLLETFAVYMLCTEEKKEFHLRRQACFKEYPKSVYWIEVGIKIGYPVFYLFFVALYAAVFIN